MFSVDDMPVDCVFTARQVGACVTLGVWCGWRDEALLSVDDDLAGCVWVLSMDDMTCGGVLSVDGMTWGVHCG